MAVLAMLAACQNDELDNAAPTYATDPDAVQVNASIMGLQTRVNTIGNGGAWEENDLFKVTNTTNPGAVSGKDQAVFSYDVTSGKFALEGEAYMVWADGANSFEAYYPYEAGKSGNSFTAFTLPEDQSSEAGIKQADYMTAKATTEKTADKSIGLTFQHQLAKVTVNITKYNDEFPEGAHPTISKVLFTVPTTPSTANGKTITVENNATKILGYVTDNGKTFMAILPPGTYTNGATFLTLNNDANAENGTPLFTVLANASLTTVGFEAGKAYTLGLTVGKNVVAISSVTVEDWTGETLPGGTAEEKRGPDASTNTIYTSEAGQIASSSDWITTAIGGGKKLEIVGPMNEDDFAVIRSYMEQHNKDEGAELNIDISKTGLTALPTDAFANKDQSIGTGYHANNILRSVVLPEGLVSIGDYAFHFCDNLTRIDLPASLKSIGKQAFDSSQPQNGAGLEELTIPDGVTYVGDSFLSRTNITRLTIPASLTSFTAGGEFHFMRKLQSLIFEGNVTEVGDMTFALSKALTSIDLSKCEQVPTVRSSENLFMSIDNPKNIHITVPAELVNGFATTDGWNKATIVAATTE